MDRRRNGELGYDGAILRVPAGIAGDFLFLLRCKEEVRFRSGRIIYSLENLEIVRMGDCVTITKSLATFLNGGNGKLLTCEQIGEALEKLSVALGINCFRCYLHGVDFTLMCPVCFSPESYFQFFPERRGHYRKNFDTGFYLQHKHKNGTLNLKQDHLCVYCKPHDGRNHLRLEDRIRGSIPKKLGLYKRAYAADLTTQDCFDRCETLLQTELQQAIIAEAWQPLSHDMLGIRSAKEIAWELCLTNADTREQFRLIFESYARDGRVNKNFGPELKKLFAAPHSLEQDTRLSELRSKIESAFPTEHYPLNRLKGISIPRNEE